jgi:hypothetical protein
MTEKQQRTMMLGMIEEFDEEDRKATKDAIDRLRHWLKMNGDAGVFALAFMTIEKSIEADEND